MNREETINYLLENYYYTSDIKFQQINLEYLNGLTDIELEIILKNSK